jgi:hypothetical protein
MNVATRLFARQAQIRSGPINNVFGMLPSYNTNDNYSPPSIARLLLDDLWPFLQIRSLLISRC